MMGMFSAPRFNQLVKVAERFRSVISGEHGFSRSTAVVVHDVLSMQAHRLWASDYSAAFGARPCFVILFFSHLKAPFFRVVRDWPRFAPWPVPVIG
jgi:hypothetical protein